MDKKSTIIIVTLIFLGALIFLVALFTRSNVETTNEAPTNTATTDSTNREPEIKEVVITPKTVLTAKHTYQNGTHIVLGEVPLPTPCHILEATGSASLDKKQVTIALVSSIKTDELCAEVVTPARFKVSVKALKSAKIGATLNGQEITLNLIEAVPDENLDNFELYIKG